MRDHPLPSDFWSVFCSRPFWRLAGGRTIATLAFDLTHSVDPFVLGPASAVDIVVG